MKVLHVIARMNVGGTARYIEELIEGASQLGYVAELATGYVQQQEIESPGFNKETTHRIKHLGRKISPMNDLRAYFELKKVIAKVNPDIIHSHTFKAGFLARLVLGDFKRVHTFHGHLFEDQSFSAIQKFAILRAEKYLAKRTNQFISVGQRVGLELRELGIGSGAKWISIAPGVRALKRIKKSEARKKLKLPATGLVIGWMARVTSVKNPQLALDIAKEFPEITFVIAGGGDLLAEIKASAGKNVRVIGWADSSVMWSAVDLVLSTSDNEGMPIALIEAQLAGLSVVATDVGSCSEVIKSAKTGFVVEKKKTELVKALSMLIKDSKKRASFGKAAKVNAERLFTVDQMNKAHIKIYKNLNLQTS
jgi:glycosyltransferase involved in cell wall biosynthesis